MARAHKFYNISVVLLALASIVLTILDFSGLIHLTRWPWVVADQGILAFFTLDYLIRLGLAKNKRAFFRQNIFDLLAIIPLSSIFSFFRLARLTRLFRLTQLFRFVRLVGFLGKLRHVLKRFLKTNGFIYLLWACMAILILAATLYAYAEHVSWGEALWWAIATTTTVGYGDVAPHTTIGKVAATILMLVGIGFIGALTSTITTYFANRESATDYRRLEQQLTTISQQNQELRQLVERLQEKLDNK
ncbi:ion transporter [Levilactobacillus angrenensis]|uniref:Ion transporter n=1 Tax=Levilactobacillus angrenensis TaxID=2486020 RepID=A0ABW1UBY4_9LACO|nr:ion transporter [Levilactobacillus angrenensis]